MRTHCYVCVPESPTVVVFELSSHAADITSDIWLHRPLWWAEAQESGEEGQVAQRELSVPGLEGVVMLMCFFCVHHCLSLLSMCEGARLEEDEEVVQPLLVGSMVKVLATRI